MSRERGPSKHGSLDWDDVAQAKVVDSDKVMYSVYTDSTRHLFGDVGQLPPKKSREVERVYTPFWKLCDGELDYVKLTKKTNSTKGRIGPISLVPGEYKLSLALPKDLNSNVLSSVSMSVGGALGALKAQTKDDKVEAQRRGMWNQYVDVHLKVYTKKYAVCDETDVLDLGVHSGVERLFQLKTDKDAWMEIKLVSHSNVKRMKVVGTLWRRDFNSHTTTTERLAQKGQNLLSKGLMLTSSVEEEPNARRSRRKSKTFLKEVSVERVLREFYREYAPEKASRVGEILSHFEGREAALLATLEEKYDVSFSENGTWTRSNEEDLL